MLPILGGQNGSVLDQEHGHFVSDKVARLAELLNDFDDTLFLQYIPSNERDASDAQPFRIIQDAPGHEPYIVMYLREDQLDHRVLASLAEARDFGKNGSQDLATTLQYQEAARQVELAKKQQEEREIAMDKASFLIRTPLHNVTMDGKKFRL